jgi:hypothetical protein
MGRLVGGCAVDAGGDDGVGCGGDGGVGWAEALRANSEATRNALCINFISILIIYSSCGNGPKPDPASHSLLNGWKRLPHRPVDVHPLFLPAAVVRHPRYLGCAPAAAGHIFAWQFVLFAPNLNPNLNLLLYKRKEIRSKIMIMIKRSKIKTKRGDRK